METINIWLAIGIAVFCMCVGALYWLTKPDKCPKCGETMLYRLDKEKYYMYCPKCSKIIEL